MTLDEAFAELKKRNEPVPTPARLPTEDEVADAEEVLETKFHPDVRRYLLEVSNVTVGALEPVTLRPPDAHTDLLTVAESAWDEADVPRKLLPICEDNGDYYCVDRKGRVVFVGGDGETGETWPNLAAWIEQVWLGEADGDDADD